MDSIPINLPSPSNEDHEPFWRLFFDPQGEIIANWSRFLLAIGIVNLSIDALFCYIPRVQSNYVDIDTRLISLLVWLRTVGDSCNFLGIIVKFRTAYEAPCPGVFRRRELVTEPKLIAWKYFKSSFIVDLVAALPLPQVYIWCENSSFRTSSTSRGFFETLMLIIFIQAFPRIYVMFPLRRKIIERTGTIARHAWSGAFYYLITYIMLSQFTGAAYYVLYIYLLLNCKETVLKEKATFSFSGWHELLRQCDMDNQIEQGMFSEIYKNSIGTRRFMQRFMYCFSWGLKCLSSVGQNFDTSASALEAIVSFLITIYGLILFAGLIAHMQTSIQSMEPLEEQHMVRQREAEEWADKHQIPPDLKKRVSQAIECDWRAGRRLDDGTVMALLPLELQCEIRRHVYADLASTLPFFTNLDNEITRAFCGYLRTFTCSKDTYVIIEGEPLKWMFLILHGQLETSSVESGSSSSTLAAGDICGSELLAWASSSSASTQNLPLSSQSFKCLTDVEAFSLLAEDVKLLGVQFSFNWKFQQILRYHFQ